MRNTSSTFTKLCSSLLKDGLKLTVKCLKKNRSTSRLSTLNTIILNQSFSTISFPSAISKGELTTISNYFFRCYSTFKADSFRIMRKSSQIFKDNSMSSEKSALVAPRFSNKVHNYSLRRYLKDWWYILKISNSIA